MPRPQTVFSELQIALAMVDEDWSRIKNVDSESKSLLNPYWRSGVCPWSAIRLIVPIVYFCPILVLAALQNHP